MMWIKKNNVVVMENDKALLLKTDNKVKVHQHISKYYIAVQCWVQRFAHYSFSNGSFSICFVWGIVLCAGDRAARKQSPHSLKRSGGWVGWSSSAKKTYLVLSELSSRTLLHRFLYQSTILQDQKMGPTGTSSPHQGKNLDTLYGSLHIL